MGDHLRTPEKLRDETEMRAEELVVLEVVDCMISAGCKIIVLSMERALQQKKEEHQAN